MMAVALLLTGCTDFRGDTLYRLPERPEEYGMLQEAIASAMTDSQFCAPLFGENRQPVQTADLTGDGVAEYVVFAKNRTTDRLEVLVFGQQKDACQLLARLDNSGAYFWQISYADMDGKPGLELVVGRGLNGELPGVAEIYGMADGSLQEMLQATCSQFIVHDLDDDLQYELMTVESGSSHADCAVAKLYRYENDEFALFGQAELSFPEASIHRLVAGSLQDHIPAVYIAGSPQEQTLQTDVLALKGNEFQNISGGNGISTRRDQIVYAHDVDADGVLELPMLGHGKVVEGDTAAINQYLIGWYSVNLSGAHINKLHTFHNFRDGWYLQLEGDWSQRVFVEIQDQVYTFSVWDEQEKASEMILSIHIFTGNDRENQAVAENRFLLYRTETMVFSAKLDASSVSYGITQESLINSFHLILPDRYMGQT